MYIHYTSIQKYCRDKRHVMSLEVWNFQVGRESEGRGRRILGIKWGGVSGQEDLMEPQACVELGWNWIRPIKRCYRNKEQSSIFYMYLYTQDSKLRGFLMVSLPLLYHSKWLLSALLPPFPWERMELEVPQAPSWVRWKRRAPEQDGWGKGKGCPGIGDYILESAQRV